MKKKFYFSLVFIFTLASASIGHAAYAYGGAGLSSYNRFEVKDNRSAKDFKEDRKTAEKWGKRNIKPGKKN